MESKVELFNFKNNFYKYKDVESTLLIKASHIEDYPLITIAIPTYRRPNLLKQAIESAIFQTETEDYEIIVVDNDPINDEINETELLIRKMNSKIISYYRNKMNIGMVGNWNRCVELSRGKYVTILHDDDWLEKDFLTKLKSRILDDKLLVFNINKINERNSVTTKPKYIENLTVFLSYFTLKTHKIAINDFFYGHMCAGTLGVVYKKDAFKSIGGFDEDWYPIHDYVFHIVYTENFKAIYYNIKIANYRILENESFNVVKQTLSMNNEIRKLLLYSKLNGNTFYKKLIDPLNTINRLSFSRNFECINDKIRKSEHNSFTVKFTSFLLYFRHVLLYLKL